jgi:hypothetical protein
MAASYTDLRSGRVANLKRGRMETRRIRRLERQRSRRVILGSIALAAIGVAVGLTLPRSTAVSALILAVALPGLASIAVRTESFAPMHGLHRVVRLPVRSAVSATLESWWSRVVGTIRAIWSRTHRVASVPREDDEAQAWWGSPRDHDPPMASVSPDALVADLVQSGPRKSP